MIIKNEIEKETNVFAACLLIPEKLIREDLANGVDLGDDKAMNDLCKKYGVTSTTMTLRLSLLNLKYKQNKSNNGTTSHQGND